MESDNELEERFVRKYMVAWWRVYYDITCLVLVQGLLMFYNSQIISLHIPILIFIFVWKGVDLDSKWRTYNRHHLSIFGWPYTASVPLQDSLHPTRSNRFWTNWAPQVNPVKFSEAQLGSTFSGTQFALLWSDQMPDGSQVSKVTLCATDSVSQWPSARASKNGQRTRSFPLWHKELLLKQNSYGKMWMLSISLSCTTLVWVMHRFTSAYHGTISCSISEQAFLHLLWGFVLANKAIKVTKHCTGEWLCCVNEFITAF